MTLPVLPSPRLPKDKLELLIRTISGVQCVWSTSRRPHLGQRPGTEQAWIFLSAQSLIGVGVDELRQVFNPVTGQNDSITVGQRQCTLVLRAESLDPSLQAFDLLERVRFRLRGATARALMVPTISLRDIQATRVLPDAKVDMGGTERALLCATMDVRLNFVVAADQLDPGEGDYIAAAPLPAPVVGGNLLP
jgi:hypothetical protein